MTQLHSRLARWGAGALATGLMVSLAACSSSDTGGEIAKELTVMIGSSGEAETKAVTEAATTWGKDNKTTVKVVAASDLTQQLGQSFSGGQPPDLFYMGGEQFQTYAGNQYLEPYAESAADADSFSPALKDAYSFDGTFFCKPKDFSTLGLVINSDLWAAAGLTDADIPTDWASLESVATKLTSGSTVGLSFGAAYTSIGVFMNQAGGSLLSKDGKKVIADTAENLEGLTQVQKMLTAGILKFPAELDSGWAGEAFGNGKAAMVIEGPWINGAVKNDFPNIKYTVAELPAGPGGKSTFAFSTCWGIPAGSDTLEQTTSLVDFLTSDEQQLAFADAFGVIPSTKTGAAKYATKYPENAAFVAGNDYSVNPVAFTGAATVIADFNSALEGLATGDPTAMLATLQTNLQAALDEVQE